MDGDGFDEDEDFEIANQGENHEDNKFDMIVGTLQEILLDEKFEKLQRAFSNENCMHFEPSEENKLIYMDIFKKY
jgi:ADP-ribosylation factor 2-binding protein